MIKNIAAQVARGFAMGAADIVPGVSGGTVALILGIYHDLLGNVKTGAHALGSLVKGDVAGFKEHFAAVNWLFIIPLGVGILVALGALSTLIERALEDYPEEMAGLFMGLVLASIVIAWGLLKSPSATHMGIAGLTAVLVFLVLGYQNGPLNDPSLIIFFGAAAIASCAMILPGISGSFLLLMMGMYVAVLGAVHDRDIVPLLAVALGASVGLGLFSSFLHKLLNKFHDNLMAIIVGIMAGSMRVLWPWPNGVGIISEEAGESVSGVGIEWPAADEWFVPTALAVGAFIFVVVLSRLGAKSEAEEEFQPPVGFAPRAEDAL